MAKATIVKITMMNERGTVVCTSNEKFFTIRSIRNPGVLDIEAPSPSDDLSISEFAEIVVGCFNPQSSFSNIDWINFTYDDVTVNVTRGEAINYPLEYIVNKWDKAHMDKIANDPFEKFSKYFTVKKFDNNILELAPSASSTIYQMAASVAGCFIASSPFSKIYEVNFTFDNKKISVTLEEDPTPQKIYQKWYDAPYEE